MQKVKNITICIENFKGTIELTCEECNGTAKIPIEDVPSGALKCPCGINYFFAENDLKNIRNTVDELKLLRENFEKPL
jgi:hypothetical protein